MSQIELAEKADISIPFLSNIERGNKWPHPETLAKLAKALDVEVYVLFQDKLQSQPVNVQNALTQYKKDVLVSLHKTVSAAINNSMDIISSHYINDDPE